MARAPKVTEKRVRELMASGHGSGFDEHYMPLLQIKRWNPSPMSVQVLKPVPPFERECHFFSHSEWYLALLFSWIGALIREQFPAWSWAHPHPEYGRNPTFDSELPWSEGMVAICQAAGIDHGVFVGTTIPYIWTIDLCLTLPWVKDPTKTACLVSVKPLESERYLYVDPLDRGPEKLEAERRYARALNIPYFVGDRSIFPGPLFAELEVLAEAATLPPSHPWANTLNRFLDAYGHDIPAYPLCDAITRLQKDFGASSDQSAFLLNHMLWHQIVDCDLSMPVKRTLPPRPGGKKLQAAIRTSLERGAE